MSRRGLVVLAVLLAFGLAIVPAAQATEVTSGPSDVDVVAGGDTETSLTVENTGDSEETVSIDITSTPDGVSVSPHQGSVTVAPGEEESVGLTVSAGTDAKTGSVDGAAGGDGFGFHVEVQPAAGFEEEPLDLGDVLVGDSESGEASIEQIGSEGSIGNVDVSVVSSDSDGTLEMSSSGSSASWEVTADDDASQHETLSWTVELETEDGVTRQTTAEARVIYPGYFGELAFGDPMVFDEPKDQGEITKTIELAVPNDGDQPLEVSSVSASSSSWDIDVDVDDDDVPDEIEGQSTEVVDVEVTADTELSEGEYDFSASASSPDVDGTSYDEDIEIVHGTELVVNGISFGDVPTGEYEEASTTLEEELGYNDVDGVEMTLVDGPDDWLTVRSGPSDLQAGGSDTVSFALEFDTEAELGETYEWTYRIEGNDDERERLRVVASPVPLDLDPIQNDLAGHSGTVPDGTLSIVETMDDEMRAGDADGDDVSTVLAFGSASVLYLEATDDATDLLEEGEHDEAQASIVQASAAYNTMGMYADQLEGNQLRSESRDVLGAAEEDLETLIDEQEAHYEQRLEDGELSLIEEATIQRELARVAVLQGDEQRAAELESEADAAFEEYSETVAEGAGAAQEADDVWESMESEQFVTVLGQPLLLNPAEYDTVTDRTAELHDSYDDAVAAFENAGESNRAETVAAEHEDRATALSTARISLFLAIGVYGIVAAGIVTRTARRMYWYVQDAHESVTGDFLM
ncbi:COG1470 family protein [Natronobacterium texcoconense]|uniref:NPCBM-associated, NEW3 domain of alpha-galactosidase n=1 Tax=Natronobacterium texcoconense TaxID=1095778 RepID=A0A1H1J3F3_NATTX|nr:hypothetical protein [Natronobacterium texcoconense]SDR44126.1 hypothetical protein SAMN04489842_4054 [Natronobacterium texcoconense]